MLYLIILQKHNIIQWLVRLAILWAPNSVKAKSTIKSQLTQTVVNFHKKKKTTTNKITVANKQQGRHMTVQIRLAYMYVCSQFFDGHFYSYPFFTLKNVAFFVICRENEKFSQLNVS